MNIEYWAQESHKLAREKGWYDDVIDPRDPDWIGRCIAMVHSELSEATECISRDEMQTWITPEGKPEGFAIELADAFIRAADLCGSLGIKTRVHQFSVISAVDRTPNALATRMAALHGDVTDLFCELRDGNFGPGAFQALFGDMLQLATECGFELEESVALKFEFNRGRPYRHGGKKL